MVEDLLVASHLLDTAIAQYSAAWSAVAERCRLSDSLEGIPQAISDAVSDELESWKSYTDRIQQVNLTINQTRNIIPPISPITVLPSDVLAQIFGVVTNMQPGYFRTTSPPTPFPISYPETLTHVCSRWRQIAIDLPRLWSWIDVPCGGRANYQRCLARAKAFAARAGPVSLDVRLVGPANFVETGTFNDFRRFCVTVAPQIMSLKFLSFDFFEEPHLLILSSIFANCIAGPLNELVVRGNMLRDTPARSMVVESSENTMAPRNQRLELSQSRLEEVLLPIRILQSTGVFFPWTSQAYYGLVELCLYSPTQGRPLITEIELRRILIASPKLRVLRLCLDAMTLFEGSTSHMPVCLNELEELESGKTISNIVPRLLLPGLNPLQLSSAVYVDDFESVENDLGKFLAHSKVTRFHLHIVSRRGGTQWGAPKLLERLPELEVLALTEVNLIPIDNELSSQEYDSPLSQSRVDTLALTRCRFDLHYLQEMAERYHVRKLKLSDCWVRTTNRASFVLAHDDEQYMPNFSPPPEFFVSLDVPCNGIPGSWPVELS